MVWKAQEEFLAQKQTRGAAGRGPAARGVLEGICQTQSAAGAGLADSGASAIRAGYREARPTAHHVVHACLKLGLCGSTAQGDRGHGQTG